MKHKGYNNNVSANANSVAQNFKFGGKEMTESLDLNTYDFGARNYDPTLGRWMNIDPLAEKFVETSPYVFAKNNPVYFTDLDGLEPVPGPYTGRGYTTSNGTIRVHRITAGQRYAVNLYYATSVTFSGAVGATIGTYDSVNQIANINESTQTRVGVGAQLATEGTANLLGSDLLVNSLETYTNASGKVVNQGNIAKSISKNVKGVLGGIGIAAAVTSDSDPSRNEAISGWTFDVASSLIPGGETNYGQPGLFDVRDSNATVEGVESRLNAVHMGINLFLNGTDFDLSTNQGQSDAADYISENGKYLSSIINWIYDYYNNKEAEKND